MLGEIEFSECLIVDGKWMNRRQMCRLYAQESDLLSDTRRQLRSFLLLRGGAVPNLAKDIVSAKNLEQMELDADETLSILLTRARDSRKRLMKCEKAIRKEFSEDPTYQSIYSIPGFGLVTSAYLSSLIVDITRFRSAKAFAAYLGIVPAQRDSGESAPHCHITRRGDARAREMLMKGVLIHIREDRDKESTVTQMYDRLLSLISSPDTQAPSQDIITQLINQGGGTIIIQEEETQSEDQESATTLISTQDTTTTQNTGYHETLSNPPRASPNLKLILYIILAATALLLILKWSIRQ